MGSSCDIFITIALSFSVASAEDKKLAALLALVQVLVCLHPLKNIKGPACDGER